MHTNSSCALILIYDEPNGANLLTLWVCISLSILILQRKFWIVPLDRGYEKPRKMVASVKQPCPIFLEFGVIPPHPNFGTWQTTAYKLRVQNATVASGLPFCLRGYKLQLFKDSFILLDLGWLIFVAFDDTAHQHTSLLHSTNYPPVFVYLIQTNNNHQCILQSGNLWCFIVICSNHFWKFWS